MTTYVGAELRLLVARRAASLCEYCLIHEDDTYLGCQVDHIISEKHGGLTIAENLALACTFCNRAKGSDIGSISHLGHFIRFYNPRTDRWREHFSLKGIQIEPQSEIGEATTRILAFNAPDRLLERAAIQWLKRYPSPDALRFLTQ
jgi:hypothetical protein